MKFINILVYFVIILKYFITKEFIIKKINCELIPELNLIIECCKLSQNIDFIKNNILQIKDWDKFISLTYSHGIFPLVYKTLKNHSLIPVSSEKSMKLDYMDIVKQNMLMTSELLKVSKLLEENQIKVVSFKGPSLSQMVYGDVVSRQYCDLDILVDERLLEETRVILEQNNYYCKSNLEDYQKENLKNAIHDISMINKINGVNIELHWTLSSDEFFIDLEKLRYLEDTKKYIISNQELNVFSNDKLFIYLCVHGYKHLWERIEWLTDIYYFIEKQNLDLNKILKISKDIDAYRMVASTLIICQRMFDLKIELDDFLLKDQKLINVTNRMLDKILQNYMYIDEKIQSKEFSMIHLYMLKNKINKIKYLKTFFKPTEYDYEKVKISKRFHFVYYFLRPLNIIKKFLGKN